MVLQCTFHCNVMKGSACQTAGALTKDRLRLLDGESVRVWERCLGICPVNLAKPSMVLAGRKCPEVVNDVTWEIVRRRRYDGSGELLQATML